MATRALLLGAAAAAAAATLTPTLVAAGPCADADLRCWNAEAVRLVNEMRARLAGLPPLAVGTVAALDNAVAHSRYLVRGPFQHQADGAATRAIGCNTFVSGENIAKGYPRRDNPAATCVQQWEGSKGHRDNILSTYHKETVVGIVSTAEGYWCTQTFQIKGEGRTGARCQPATRTRPPTNVEAPPPVPLEPEAGPPPPPPRAPASRPSPPPRVPASRPPPPRAPSAPQPARPARGGGGGGGGKPNGGNKPKGGRGGRKNKGCRGGKNKGGRRGNWRGGRRGNRRGGRRGNPKGGRGGRRGNGKGGHGGRGGRRNGRRGGGGKGGRGGRRNGNRDGRHNGGRGGRRNGGGRHGRPAPWAPTHRTCQVGHRRGGRIVWETVPCDRLRGGQSPRRQ